MVLLLINTYVNLLRFKLTCTHIPLCFASIKGTILHFVLWFFSGLVAVSLKFLIDARAALALNLTRRWSFERNLFKFLIACQSCVLAGFGVAKYRSKLFMIKLSPRDATKSSSQILDVAI
jgi:hypothetical protein